MSANNQLSRGAFTRRSLLTGSIGVGAAALLAACSSPAGGSTSGGKSQLKFWDMPWGQADYNVAAKKLVTGYSGASMSYQVIQWATFVQSFSSAIASNTGPAVSSGASFQALQFSQQGAIAYADDLIADFKKDGTIDDFLPGTIESLKTDKGYVGIPWQVDVRPIWYRKSALDKAGVEPPTDWASWLTAAKAMAKHGVYAWGTAAGSGAPGWQLLASLMLNNGGGFFDKDGNLDVVTDRNIESLDFIQEMIGAGAIDPGAVSYTNDNLLSQWKSGKIGMGYYTPGLDTQLGDTTGDILVLDPPAGPHGDKGGLYYVNNLMMYKNTPSQKASEDFLSFYVKNLHTLWNGGVVPALPAMKSIADLPSFKKNTQALKIVNTWQPICKTLGATASTLSAANSHLDSSTPVTAWAQTVFGGKTSPKDALTTLQAALPAILKN